MRKFFVGFLLLGSFFISSQVFSANTDIVINEIGAYATSTHEWVEIYNKGSEPVDLTGWKFWENSTNHGLSVSTTDALVSAGEYAVIVQDAGQFLLDYPNFTGSIFDSSFTLNESGENIGLKDASGNFVEQFTYVSAPNFSLQRRDSLLADYTSANWAEHASGNTVGAVNVFADVVPEQNTTSTSGAENVIVAPPPAGGLAQSQSGSGGGGSVSTIIASSTATFSKKPVTVKTSVSKEKAVGLKWEIKYNLRLRQYEEGVFNASKTIDPRGGRIEYSWNFSDQIVFGANIKYAFTTSGKHEVIVRATSTAGTVDAKKITIMVYPATEIAGAGVIFSELLPRAGSDEEEYIQLKNISAQSVNMSNWKVVYKNDIFEIPTSTTLAANDYLIFYKTITGFTLNNSGGELLLLNQENILIDEVEYGKAEEDAVYVFDNGKWNWEMPTTSAKIAVAEKNTTTKKYSGRFFTNITDARAGQKGDWARVKGVVAVLPGVFGSQYFYLTDGNAGIQIYQNKKDFPELALGDLAQVYGRISEANGIKRINIKSKDDVDILAIGQFVTSAELNLDEIDASLAGGLVQTQGEITEIKSNFMYVDNGNDEVVVYFKQGAKIDKHKFLEGENARVVGILEQTKTGWQIWPRSNDDIESLGPSADLLKKQAISTGGDMKEKYLTATAGGVTTLILAFLARARGALVLGGIKRFGLLLVGFIKKDKG